MTANQPFAYSGFPAGAEKLFRELWDEVAALHAMWNMYLDLFGTTESMRVVEATTPDAFKLIEVALRHYMVMAFGRLTDPASTGKGKGEKPNLTLERFLDVVDVHWSEEDRRNAREMLQKVRDAGAVLKKLRDREVGHKDLTTALATHPEPIPPVQKQVIESLFDLIAELMNWVEGKFNSSTTLYGAPPLRGTGADLIYLLRQLLNIHEAERKKLVGGEAG